MVNVLVIGFFDPPKNQTGGEYTKGKAVFKFLSQNLPINYHVDSFDIGKNSTTKVSFFFKLKKAILKKDILIFMPAGERGLLATDFVCYHYCSKKNVPIFYPVVGGWLGETAKNHPFLAKHLRNYKGIYCETRGLIKKLHDLGMNNLTYSPVFSQRKQLTSAKIDECCKLIKENPIRFCSFCRVSEAKGILDSVEAISSINASGDNPIFYDIFGPLDPPDFFKKLKPIIEKSNGKIKYCGMIPDGEVINTLSHYFGCLFPTHFYGEGFPASVLESLMSGTPVIGSDWCYNNEIIIDGITGFLYPCQDVNALKKRIECAINQQDLFLKMRHSSWLFSQNFTIEKSLSGLLKDVSSQRQQIL